MDFEEVAELLRVKLEVVTQLAHQKALKVVRIGTERRVRAEDLSAFLAAAEE
jgi:excisionase family DNA binding protein